MHLKKEESLNAIVLKEDIQWGQRVIRFEISGGNDVEHFKPITTGTTIGHKRIVKFPLQKLKYLRIKYTESKASALLLAIEGYEFPESL